MIDPDFQTMRDALPHGNLFTRAARQIWFAGGLTSAGEIARCDWIDFLRQGNCGRATAGYILAILEHAGEIVAADVTNSAGVLRHAEKAKYLLGGGESGLALDARAKAAMTV